MGRGSFFPLTPYQTYAGCSGCRYGPLKPETRGQSLKKPRTTDYIRVIWNAKYPAQPAHDGHFYSESL